MHLHIPSSFQEALGIEIPSNGQESRQFDDLTVKVHLGWKPVVVLSLVVAQTVADTFLTYFHKT